MHVRVIVVTWSDLDPPLRYSVLHVDQNLSANLWTNFHWLCSASLFPNPGTKNMESGRFCVSSNEGERTAGASRSVETEIRGLLLTIAHTSIMGVGSTSCVKSEDLFFKRTASKIRRTDPIMHSHTPPPPEVGRMGRIEHPYDPVLSQVVLYWSRHDEPCIDVQFLCSTNNFFPRSDQICWMGPRKATNLRR
jgi:hypothetical protein